MECHVLLQSVPVGNYIGPFRLGVLLVFAVIWWRLLTWLDKDAEVARLPREWVNLSAVGTFILGLVTFLLIPLYWLALMIFIVVMLASFGTYLAIRNHQIGLSDLINDIKNLKILKGGKKEAKLEDIPGTVALASKSGRPIAQPPAESPDRQAYDVIQQMLTDPLRRGMERLDLVPIEGASLAQYWVDGVVYNGSQFNRQGAAAAITTLKRFAGMDINERRKPQVGAIQAAVEGARHEIQVHTAGSSAGESLRLLVDPKKRHTMRLDQVGLADSQMQLIKTAIQDRSGVVLVAIPKGQGLTSFLYALIREHDAFLTHIHSIERDPELDLEGVTQNKLAKGASPQDELQQIQWVISQEPDTILVPELHNPKSVRDLIGFAVEGKRVYIGLRSASAIDAINDFRTMVGDDALALKNLRMVIAGRVVRKLCDACKQPYQPDQDTLRKLNLDHGRTQQFFQARTQAMRDQKGNPIVCNFCQELRYRGRTGVYEVLDITDEIRQAILSNASVNQLRAMFRKLRGRFVQEHALDLVELGVTSIQEVLRAMRGQEQDPNAAKIAAGSAAGTGTFTSSGTQAAPGQTKGPQQRSQRP